VEGMPVEGYYDTLADQGFYLPKISWKVLCRRLHDTGVVNSSIVNDPLGEPGCTPLYVGFPSAWGFADGDRILFPVRCRRAP
jgi:hypothetical protein